MERIGEVANRLMDELRKKKEANDKKKKQILAMKLGKGKKCQSKQRRTSVKQTSFF